MDSEFLPRNLPYGAFSCDGAAARCAAAIGDMVLDIAAVQAAGLMEAEGNFARLEVNHSKSLDHVSRMTVVRSAFALESLR